MVFWNKALEKLRNFDLNSLKMNEESYFKRILFVTLILSLAYLAIFGVPALWEVFNKNAHGSLKVILLLSFLNAFMVIWIVFIIFSSLKRPKISLSMTYFFVLALLIMRFYPTKFIQTSVAIVIGISLFLFSFLLRNEKNPRIWFWATLLLMFGLLTFGVMAIDSVYGKTQIKLNLNINGDVLNKYLGGKGEIICLPVEDSHNSLLNQKLVCSIKPQEIKIQSGTLRLDFENQESRIVNFYSNDTSFLLGNETTQSLFFSLNISDKKNKEIYVTTASTFRFYSEEEQRERESEFLKYLIGLITAVFVSVPIMVYHLRHLFKREDSEEF